LKNKINIPTENVSPINLLDDDIWYVTDAIDGSVVEINWINLSVRKEFIPFIKYFIRGLYKVSDENCGAIYCRPKSLKDSINIVNNFLNTTNNIAPEKFVSDLNIEQLKKIVLGIAIKEDGSLLSKSSTNRILQILTLSSELYKKGKSVDGVSCNLPMDLNRYFFRDFFEDEKQYKKWISGGSFDLISVQTAMIFLSDMLVILERPMNSFLIEYFKFQRSEKCIHPKYIFHYKERFLMPEILRRLEDDKLVTASVLRYRRISLNTNEISNLIELAKIFIKYGFTAKTLPTVTKLNDECYKTYGAALVVTTMLSGARISELSTIKISSFQVDEMGNNYFQSDIKKTHDGMPVKRSISGEAKKAIELCANLSYIDDKNLSPFASTFRGGSFLNSHSTSSKRKVIGESQLRAKIKNTYRVWLNTQPDIVKSYAPSKVIPHTLRHVFAAVALRRFDGRVSDQIRRHFVHTYSSRFTHAYTNEKLEEDFQVAAEKEYIQEIVSDIAHGNEDFYGPVALRIKKKISKTHKFGTLDEIAKEIEKISDEYETIVPHEFGFCVPNKKELAKAQCKDPETGEARIWEESNTKNCTKCVHRLTHISQAESLIRIAISHQEFINQSVLVATTRKSKDIVKQCEAALNEMGKRVEDYY